MILIGITIITAYNINIGAVDKKNKNTINFEVTENSTYSNLGDELYKAGLIKSKTFYKIYVKLNKPSNLQKGIYALNKSMSLKEIINSLGKGSTYNPYIFSITIKEGYNIRKIASIIDEKTDNSYDDVMNKITDKKYINTLINKYWFLSTDITNADIYYPLEGYLFPETYQISSKNTVEEIFEILLNQMDKILTKYKTDIQNSSYTINQIVTLASIIELEAGNANDRAGVAGVFYNRIKGNWSLGSDVTTYYANKIDDFKHSLTKTELNSCNNKYNTRCSTYKGLPVGPISNPSEESLKAAINPTSHNYYYFVADCSGKTYLNTNSTGHNNTITKLKKENNWCA